MIGSFKVQVYIHIGIIIVGQSFWAIGCKKVAFPDCNVDNLSLADICHAPCVEGEKGAQSRHVKLIIRHHKFYSSCFNQVKIKYWKVDSGPSFFTHQNLPPAQNYTTISIQPNLNYTFQLFANEPKNPKNGNNFYSLKIKTARLGPKKEEWPKCVALRGKAWIDKDGNCQFNKANTDQKSKLTLLGLLSLVQYLVLNTCH